MTLRMRDEAAPSGLPISVGAATTDARNRPTVKEHEMAHRVLPAHDADWRPSNQMAVSNNDIGKQLEATTLGARLWRLEPGQRPLDTATKTRPSSTSYSRAEGDCAPMSSCTNWSHSRRSSSIPTPSAKSSTTRTHTSSG